MKQLHTIPVPNHRKPASPRVLYELAEMSIKLVASSAALLEQIVLISIQQAEVSDLFAVEAQSLAMCRKLTGKQHWTPLDEAELESVLRLAYATAQSSAKSAEAMRALIGSVSIPASGTLQLAGEQAFTLLDIHMHLQQIEQTFEKVSLCSPLLLEHAQSMRAGIAEMVATALQNAHAAIRAAEAADYIHVHATSLIQTLEASLSPLR